MNLDPVINNLSQQWINASGLHKYVYNWRWMGLPIIQFPADIMALQEIIWMTKPTVIIETGVARGGSIIFNASQMAMLDLCEKGIVSLHNSPRRCIGIDIEIREHNRKAIKDHPLNEMIILVEGSSIDGKIIDKVKSFLVPGDNVMVILDSNHTHDHVARELDEYSQLVTVGSYIVVHDTGIEFSPQETIVNRDWGKGNNPLSAAREFLLSNKNFESDEMLSGKLQVTSSPHGYLKRIA